MCANRGYIKFLYLSLNFALNLKLSFKKVLKKKKKKKDCQELPRRQKVGQLAPSAGLLPIPTPKAVTGLNCFSWGTFPLPCHPGSSLPYF